MENSPVQKKGFVCNKVRFATEEAAQFALDKIKATSDRKVIPVRVYLCKCKSWHLTSKRDIFEDEKVILSLRQTIETLKVEIDSLKQRNVSLDEKVLLLSKRNNKEENVAVKSDSRVKNLKKELETAQNELKRHRADTGVLITKLNQPINKSLIDSLTLDKLIELKVFIEVKVIELLTKKS